MNFKLLISLVLLSFPALAQLTFAPSAVNGEINLQSGFQFVYITNRDSIDKTLNLSINKPGVSLILNRCDKVLSPNKTCYISVSIDSNILPQGTSIFSLNDSSTPIANIKYINDAIPRTSVFSKNSENISDFSQQEIIIQNKTSQSKTYNPFFSGIDASKFEIILNRCSSSIIPNGTCRILYRLKPQSIGTYSASLNDAQVQVPLSISAIISGQSPGAIQPINEDFSVSATSLDFGTLTKYGLSNPLIVNVTNNGNKTLNPILEFSSKAQLVLNRCSSILVGKTCSISLGLNPDYTLENGPILNQKLIIKAKALSSGTEISLTGILSVPNTCQSFEHQELGLCVRNTRTCSISNGSGTQIWNSGSWQSCVVNSCDSGYYNNLGTSCSLITYSPTYSSYSPSIPSNQVACDGTVTSARTIISCLRNDNLQFVSPSNCSDSSPSVVTQSPAGNKNISIANGSEIFSCGLGSSTQNFVSRSCNSGYYNNGVSCQAIVYTPTYSSYSPAIPANLVACDGTVTSNRTITSCKQQHDNLSVSTSLCSDSSPSVVTQSPAGTKNVSIANGSELKSCVIGSSTQSLVSRTCNSGYYDNGSSCSPVTYVATYSSYSPAIPTNLVACDGTVTSTRTITQCKEFETNNIVANSFCSDSSPSVVTQSPAGTKNISIANGSEVNSCALGSSALSLVSRTCNGGYYNDGLICRAFDALVSAGTLSYLTVGDAHGCAISSSGNAYCWGNNTYGQLGIGSTSPTTFAAAVSTSGALSGKIIKSISAKASSTCAIANDDKAYCWGNNSYGQLGTGSGFGQSTVPVAVSTSGALSGKTIKSIFTGGIHSCAIANDDRVYCWGNNDYGQLGNGSTSTTTLPVAVNMGGRTAKSLSLGFYHTCMIASDNLPYCWGRNDWGQLGAGYYNSFEPSPVSISTSFFLGGKAMKSIALGAFHTCVLTTDNLVSCWGSGYYLGNGSSSNVAYPSGSISIGGIAVSSLSSGFGSFIDIPGSSGNHSLTTVVGTNGSVYYWGSNQGSVNYNPIQMSFGGALSGHSIKSFSSGSTMSCAIADNFNIYCIGGSFSNYVLISL